MAERVKVRLWRRRFGDQGTFGKLQLPDGRSWISLELPWKGNLPRVSCIPAGVYLCKWGWSRRVGWRYEVLGVPGRSAVLIHSCNRAGDREKGWKSDLLGCIGLGRLEGKIEGQRAILQSRLAMNDFHTAMQGQDTFTLEIYNADSTS